MGESASVDHLAIAFVPGVTLTKWTRTWEERRPDVPLTVAEVAESEQVAALHDGSADLAFVRLPIDADGLNVIPLYREVAVAVAAKDHAIAAADSLVLADLEGESMRSGAAAPDDPWGASDLTWATPSPPPAYNFAEIPVVTSRHPLWTDEEGTPAEELPVVEGVRNDRREVLLTTPVDAIPSHRWGMPGPSIWPLLAALALTVMFIWSVFEEWGVIWGAIPVAVTLTAWFWPKKGDENLKGEG